MWPWEHVAVGYIAFSLGVRLLRRRPPTAVEALVLVVGTQFPDLVDKPLAWTFRILPTGTTLAHSAFVAVPLSALAVVVAARWGHRGVGAAFAAGYLLHLLGDVLYGTVTHGGSPAWDVVLWPLIPKSVSQGQGFFERFLHHFGGYRELLASPEASAYVAFELALLGAAVALWLYDGAPPLVDALAGRNRGSPEP